jgi:hypothetical protein
MIIITGALLFALVLYFGWIGGFNSDFFSIKLASLAVEKGSADLPDPAKSDRLAPQASSANTTVSSVSENSKRGVQTTDPLLTKQAKRGTQAAAVEHTKVAPKPAPVPETRPTTIEGWILLEVKGGTAVLEGPNGVWSAIRGDTVPGVGKIDSIVRWGNRYEPLARERAIERVQARLEALVRATAAPRCGARSKRTGKPCRAAAMPNGRCKVHGGKSTGPRTPEGLERSRRANWKRGYYSREAMVHGTRFGT